MKFSAMLATTALLLHVGYALGATDPPEIFFPLVQSLAKEYDKLAAENYRLPDQQRESETEYRARLESGSELAKGKAPHTAEPAERVQAVVIDDQAAIEAAETGQPIKMTLFEETYTANLSFWKPKIKLSSTLDDRVIVEGRVVGFEGKTNEVHLVFIDDGTVRGKVFIGDKRFWIRPIPDTGYQALVELSVPKELPQSLEAGVEQFLLERAVSIYDQFQDDAEKKFVLEWTEGLVECAAYARIRQIKAELRKDNEGVKEWGSNHQSAMMVTQMAIGVETAASMVTEKIKAMFEEIGNQIDRVEELDYSYPDMDETCKSRMDFSID